MCNIPTTLKKIFFIFRIENLLIDYELYSPTPVQFIYCTVQYSQAKVQYIFCIVDIPVRTEQQRPTTLQYNEYMYLRYISVQRQYIIYIYPQ